MTAGRKPLAVPDIVDVEDESESASNGLAVMREQVRELAVRNVEAEQHVRAVALQVGYQLPADCTDPDLIQRDISANMRRSVEACLEVGRGLVVLKEACDHGQFAARLDVLGIDARVAQRFMSSARKFSNAASTPLLKAAGSQTKLFELLVLDDSQVEELELTGQTGELTLDDVAAMSVKELRAKLRELRHELKATEEISAEKTVEIERLREAGVRIRRQPPDAVLAELAKETAGMVTETLNKLRTSVNSAFTALAQHYVEHGGGDCRHLMAGHVGELQRALNELREAFNLRDIEGDGTPEWMSWPGNTAAPEAE
ncbi:hypothetical protein C667_02913 [Thauera phenylacetica B4P]|uniref:DUF3102 domain-containing protein n=1 Tax=Thauera phenylacetica B4P TaxID=1234382 RepID=N6YWG9_9RHOO|nr:hypothetical protein [Thauera phenylacetica]ENO98621.1 hypothetical protein C667_02913 [Thauera phenylacetica B4P]